MIRLLLWLIAGPAFAVTAPQFWVHTAPQKQASILAWQGTSQWVTEWISDGTGSALWRDPNNPEDRSKWNVEHWALRDGWLMIDWFSNDFVGAPRFNADCVKAEIQDVQTGITAPLTCRGGHYYVPFLMPRDPWRVRMWLLIAGSLHAYWEAQFSPQANASGACMTEPQDVIVQREVWWDSGGGGPKHDGWAEGSGTAAFDAKWNPITPAVTYGVEAVVAKGQGVIRRTDFIDGRTMCLYAHWSWG